MAVCGWVTSISLRTQKAAMAVRALVARSDCWRCWVCWHRVVEQRAGEELEESSSGAVSRAMLGPLGPHADSWRDCHCRALGRLRVGAA